MKRKQYDLDFKKMIVAKGKEIGNMTAVARQHELDPNTYRFRSQRSRCDFSFLSSNQ